MKKLLAISVLINLILSVWLIRNKMAFKEMSKIIPYDILRHNVIDDYPIHKGDIVFIGDSETQYFDVCELFNNSSLKNRGLQGEQTAGLLKRVGKLVSSYPKTVFIETGVNDLRANVKVDIAINNVDKILKIIHKVSPTIDIYLEEIFPASLVNSTEIIKYNQALKQIANINNVHFIPLYNAFNNNGKLKYDCGDGMHLNGNGYHAWAAILTPFILTKN